MYINNIFIAGALASVAAAVPLHQPLHHPLHMHHHHKRDVVWTTKVVEEFVTVPVTVTVTGSPGETPGSNFGFGPRPMRTSHIFQTITVQPQPAPPAASQPPPPASAPPAPAPVPSQPVAPAPQAPAPSQPAAPVPQQPAPSQPAPAPSQPAAPVPQQPAPSQPAAPQPSTPAPQPPTGGGGSFSGDITYYTPGLGSCGVTNTETDHIVALAAGMMAAEGAANPNDNPLCGKSITISYGGKTAQATIMDTCPGCSGASLDLTPSLFEVFAPLSVGRISGVQWSYN